MTTAHLIARGTPHPVAAHLGLARFAAGRMLDERGVGPFPLPALKPPPMLRIPCPWCGDARRDRIPLSRRCRPRAPGCGRWHGGVFIAYVYERDNPRGWHLEWWLHVGGCRRLLKVLRHTLTHEIRWVGGPAGVRRCPG